MDNERYHPRETDVLAAATILFAERGYHGTSVPLVAKQARVGLNTLYKVFPSKEALVNGVYRHCKRRLGAALIEDFPFFATPREQFHAFWVRMAAFADDEPEAFAFLELHHHGPWLDDTSRTLELEILAPIAIFFEQAQAAGVLRPVPVAVGLSMVWGAFVGLVKSARAGYLVLDPTTLAEAEATAWASISSPSPTID